MDDMLFRLRQALTRLIASIRVAKHASATLAPIFVHGYDCPVPDGLPYPAAIPNRSASPSTAACWAPGYTTRPISISFS
jgi:hypothetical protein